MTCQLVIFRTSPPPSPPPTLNLKKKIPVSQLIKKFWPYMVQHILVNLRSGKMITYDNFLHPKNLHTAGNHHISSFQEYSCYLHTATGLLRILEPNDPVHEVLILIAFFEQRKLRRACAIAYTCKERSGSVVEYSQPSLQRQCLSPNNLTLNRISVVKNSNSS